MSVKLPEDIRILESLGDFKSAVKRIKKILNLDRGPAKSGFRKLNKPCPYINELPSLLRKRLENEFERIERVKKDYSIERKRAFKLLKKEIPKLTIKKFQRWMDNGYINYRWLNGKEKYFNRFIPNLFRVSREAENLRTKKSKDIDQEAENLLHSHIEKVLKLKSSKRYILPTRRKIKMKVSLKPNAIPSGETVRCWLPFPRIGEQQTEANLISSFPKKYILAPEDSIQRTISFKQKIKKGKPTVFKVEYEYVINASFTNVEPNKIKPYDKDALYIKYTKEQSPHILFTSYLKNLSSEIVGKEKNPYQKAWKIYNWITHNVKYALVCEYSTYENISEYVATNLKGDCGMQALLFITLCRISKIPARWQSGWYMNKFKVSPHDWAQFYIKPYGWLFADASFGGHRVREPKLHKFYFGNIDNFRLVCNNDISAQFTPLKKYIRSDPVDNQRGELEWEKGNIYYDKFTYHIQLT
ncbi:transglutaminase domain-containing protein [candidate division WOR-3 bacterium]|nr:transglutaminase domain-containing protein [candidate division WOR-3 bacterium]